MNFMKGTLFHRSTEPEEVEITQESGGGVLAVWGSPGCGKTVTAVKIAKHLASQKKNVALLLCDMTAPMMPCICPPSELECDKSLGSIFAAQRISVNLIKHIPGGLFLEVNHPVYLPRQSDCQGHAVALGTQGCGRHWRRAFGLYPGADTDRNFYSAGADGSLCLPQHPF